jgi:hypothetical protein
MPCTLIKLRLQNLRPARNKILLFAFSARCRSAIHYSRRFLGLIHTAYDRNQADVRAIA